MSKLIPFLLTVLAVGDDLNELLSVDDCTDDTCDLSLRQLRGNVTSETFGCSWESVWLISPIKLSPVLVRLVLVPSFFLLLFLFSFLLFSFLSINTFF